MGPPKILILGESGGMSCFYDLAEWYRLRNLIAEREDVWRSSMVI